MSSGAAGRLSGQDGRERPRREVPAMDKPITPCLWFDGNAREAAEFYTSIFPNSKMGEIGKAPEGGTPSNEPGAEMVVEFTLNGQNFTGLNGGPMFTFSEA